MWRISCPVASLTRCARSQPRSEDGLPGSAFRIRNRPRMSPGLRCCSLWPLVSRTPSPHMRRGAAPAMRWPTSSAASITMVWRPSNRGMAAGRRRCTPAPSATGSWRKLDVLQTRSVTARRVVAYHTAAGPAARPGRPAAGERLHHLAGLTRSRTDVAARPQLVRHGSGAAQAQVGNGHGDRSRHRTQKKLIEAAYTQGERLGLAVWGEDEAGPFRRSLTRGSSGARPGTRPATRTSTCATARPSC